MLFGIGFSDCR